MRGGSCSSTPLSLHYVATWTTLYESITLDAGPVLPCVSLGFFPKINPRTSE